MNEGEFGGNITLVRVGGQGGNDTGDECGHCRREQIDPSKLTKPLSGGQVQKDKDRLPDGQQGRGGEKDDGNGKKKKRLKKKKGRRGDGETPAGWISFGTNSSTVFAS